MADLEGTELCDSHLDIHELFAYYNDTYFEGKLHACTVAWSSLQMTLYAVLSLLLVFELLQLHRGAAFITIEIRVTIFGVGVD
jgi:hypothetical protein